MPSTGRVRTVYPAAGDDRWVAIAVVDDETWSRCAHVLGVSDPSLATLAGRLAARDAVDAVVSAWTRGRDPGAAAEVLQAAGVSAMAVLHGDDLRADPHLHARGSLPTVTHPEMGPTCHSGNPLRLSRTPVVTAVPAPRLGEHTADVLARWLGIDAASAARLVANGVCR